jgi:hypothetical protein
MRSARSASLFVVVLVAALLVACQTVPTAVVSEQPLPVAPDRYRLCFAGVTDLPPGAWSAAVTADVVGRLRVSELEKTDCGRDFLEWYDELRAGRLNPE